MMNRNQFGPLLFKGLRKVYDDVYKEWPEQFSQIFNVLTSEQSEETDYSVTGFKLLDKASEAEPVNYQDALPGYSVTYKHDTFKGGFTVTKEMLDDDQYNVMKKKAAGLARAVRRTVETEAAKVINGAFGTTVVTGGDGKALCATDHPRLDGGTAQSNKGTGKLTEANLLAGILAMRDLVDDQGQKIMVKPDKLVVAPYNEAKARILLESTQRTATANNDINPVKGALSLVVYDWITAANKEFWFLIDSTMNELNFFWREKPSFTEENSFDTDSRKFKARCRFSVGFSDWHGVYGSDGTTS
jgi:phage major head subunit gpT-like protein